MGALKVKKLSFGKDLTKDKVPNIIDACVKGRPKNEKSKLR